MTPLVPVDAEARETFARLVEREFVRTRTGEYQQGFDAGTTVAKSTVEELILRAELSSEEHADVIAVVLQCLLEKLDQ